MQSRGQPSLLISGLELIPSHLPSLAFFLLLEQTWLMLLKGFYTGFCVRVLSSVSHFADAFCPWLLHGWLLLIIQSSAQLLPLEKTSLTSQCRIASCLTLCQTGFFFLDYNCFTMLCSFIMYNNVNQLYVYIYPFPLGLSSHLTPILHL